MIVTFQFQTQFIALAFAVNSMVNMKGRIGRHQSNIFKTILSDISKINISLKCTDKMT